MASRKAKWLQKQMRRMQRDHEAELKAELINTRYHIDVANELRKQTRDRDGHDAAVVLFRRYEQTPSGPVYRFGVTIDSRWLQYQMHKSADGRFTDFSEIQYDIERKFHNSLRTLIEEIANK